MKDRAGACPRGLWGNLNFGLCHHPGPFHRPSSRVGSVAFPFGVCFGRGHSATAAKEEPRGWPGADEGRGQRERAALERRATRGKVFPPLPPASSPEKWGRERGGGRRRRPCGCSRERPRKSGLTPQGLQRALPTSAAPGGPTRLECAIPRLERAAGGGSQSSRRCSCGGPGGARRCPPLSPWRKP